MPPVVHPSHPLFGPHWAPLHPPNTPPLAHSGRYPECLALPFSPLQIPLCFQDSVQRSLLSGSLPSWSESLLPVPFHSICVWLSLTFPILTFILDNLPIFLTTSQFLFRWPDTQDKEILGWGFAFKSPLGITSLIPSISKSAILPAKCFLSSSLPLCCDDQSLGPRHCSQRSLQRLSTWVPCCDLLGSNPLSS